MMKGIAAVLSNTIMAPTVGADTTVGEYLAEFTIEMPELGPMPVRVVRDEDGTLLIVDLVTGSYGVGYVWSEAYERLAGALHRQFEFLRAEGPGGLAAHLAIQLEQLERRAAISAAPGSMQGITAPGRRQLALAA